MVTKIVVIIITPSSAIPAKEDNYKNTGGLDNKQQNKIKNNTCSYRNYIINLNLMYIVKILGRTKMRPIP